MTQSLQEFISTVGNYGVARNNKFEVFLPAGLNVEKYSEAKLGGDTRLVTAYAESVDIPGKVINTIGTRLQGKMYEMPLEFLYSETLNITFLVDTRMQIRKYFDNWLYLVFPNGGGVGFNPNLPEIYRTDVVKINIIDYLPAKTTDQSTLNSMASMMGYETENKVKSPQKANVEEYVTGSYQFYGLYPKHVSGIQAINSGRDFQRLRVSFAFDYMTSTFDNEAPEQTTAPSLIRASGSNTFVPPALNRGTGTGLLGSINGMVGNVTKTVTGITSSVGKIGSNISNILGL